MDSPFYFMTILWLKVNLIILVLYSMPIADLLEL